MFYPVDSVIHFSSNPGLINLYPADSVVCFVNTYPLDSDLSGGYHYPAFEQLRPTEFVQALAGAIVLLRKDTTFTVPLSTQVYKWVAANLKLGEGVTM